METKRQEKSHLLKKSCRFIALRFEDQDEHSQSKMKQSRSRLKQGQRIKCNKIGCAGKKNGKEHDHMLFCIDNKCDHENDECILNKLKH